MNSSELGDISLSGLIRSIIDPEQAQDALHRQNVVQVDPNTIQGQNQPSPDSNGLANLAITGSPQPQPPNVSDSDIVNILGLQTEASDSDMQNLSDKLGEFSLGAPMAPVPRAGKRSSKEAENDSASQLIPRQMERQQSSIHTPNVSSNLSDILQNCKQINDL